MSWQLQFDEHHQRWQITDATQAQGQPFYLDFLQGKLAFRYRQGFGKRQPLAKAIKITPTYYPTVLDATAGLGQDSFMLACCGCQITLLERSAILVKLLQDALQRAATDQNLATIIAKLNLIQQDSIEFLTTTTQSYDVIYIDVMYPPSKKSALVKKPMRIVRELVGDDNDASQLLQLALTKAKRRTVVKRARHAPWLDNQPPSHQIFAKTIRFDVYTHQTSKCDF